jgi:hypothetical protein
VGAYRAALQEYTRERVPLDWAMAQNNLDAALGLLSQPNKGKARKKVRVESRCGAVAVGSRCKSQDLTCRTVSDQIAVDAVEPRSEPAILAWSPSAWARRAVKPRSRLPVRRRRRA